MLQRMSGIKRTAFRHRHGAAAIIVILIAVATSRVGLAEASPPERVPKTAVANSHARKWVFAPEAGASWLSYKEGRRTGFNAIGLRAGMMGRYLLSSRTSLDFRSSLTAVPVNHDGLSLPVGFVRLEGLWLNELGKADTWNIKLGLGGYYRRMFVSGERFGYKNLTGPFVTGSVAKSLSGSNVARLDLKISAILNGLAPLAPSNRELALAFGWERSLSRGRAFGLAAEYSELRVRINYVQIESSFLTLGVNYAM